MLAKFEVVDNVDENGNPAGGKCTGYRSRYHLAIFHLQKALDILNARTNDRERRNVEGTHDV